MSFQQKYQKYKNKYLKLKNQIAGAERECPDNTLNRKLVLDNAEDCNNVRATGKIKELTDPVEIEKAKEGERKGYLLANLNRNCYIKEGYSDIKPVVYNYDHGINPNSRLSIATYNVMGIDRNEKQEWLIEKRIPLIAREIESNNIDIVCFQEMSYTLCKLLQEKLSDYVIFENLTELNYLLKDNKKFDIIDKLPESTTKSSYTSRHHDIECSVAIKKSLKPKRIIIDPLGGNLTYSNSLMIIEFDNLVIFNCYLQAGTKFSPGQDKLYLNYSRCREQLVEYVIEKVKTYNNIPIVILGDFNIDLNDDGTNFPEVNIINGKLKQELGFVDNWEKVNRGDIGYTENTDINLMRWNDKFIEKKTRVDAIFTRGIEIDECRLLGHRSNLPVPKEYEPTYITSFTPNKNLSNLKYIEGTDKLPIFSSDHFGVLSKINLIK